MPLTRAARIRALDRDGEWKLERRPMGAAADFDDYRWKLRYGGVLCRQAAERENEKRHRERSNSPFHEIHPSI
jgi:hypothetical protein